MKFFLNYFKVQTYDGFKFYGMLYVFKVCCMCIGPSPFIENKDIFCFKHITVTVVVCVGMCV